MKRMLLCILMMVSLVSQSALADCKPWDDKHIQRSNDYNPPKYLYSVDCHVEFGRVRGVERLREQQVRQLKKSLEMKDLALKHSNERVENWKKTTYKVEDKLLKLEKNCDRMKWVYFGLGILATGLAVKAAGELK